MYVNVRACVCMFVYIHIYTHTQHMYICMYVCMYCMNMPFCVVREWFHAK